MATKKKPAQKVATLRNTTTKKAVKIGLLALSIGMNVFFIGIAIAAKTGYFDYAIVNQGIEIMCSDSFHQRAVKNSPDKRGGMLLEYNCGQNNSLPYYEKGFKEYLKSKGLTSQE